MANQTRKTGADARALEERRRQRSESRTSSTYKAFLKELCRVGSMTEELAESAAASVLCALEQRLMGDESRHLESQLPLKLQKLLYRCARHETGMPPRKFGQEELLAMVGEDLGMQPSEAEPVARAVFRVVAEHVSRGEIEDVIQQLPADLRELWPSEVVAEVEARRPRESRPRQRPAEKPPDPRADVIGLVSAIEQLPFAAQLGVLRTIAPKIIARMEEDERGGFIRDLNSEIERAERGEPAYDIRPGGDGLH
jgi:uncharacterized protein (DUF2267 family)